jgi:hypothetical protein
MSLQLIAKQMEAKGRNGDSVLVHMTTGEVAGLQKLAENAGGSLSVNPETGLVEASFLKSILPTLVGAGVTFMTANPYAGAAAGAAVGGYQARRSGQDVGMGAITGGLGGYGGFQLASGAGLGKAAGQALTGKQMFQSGLMALAPSLNAPMPQQQNTQPLLSTDINQSSIPFQNIQAYAPPMPRYTGGAGNVYIPQFRGAEGGTVKMASGGAFEDIRAYEGAMPSYSYVDGNFLRATTQPTTPVRPQGLLSRLASPEVSQPLAVAPVIRPPVPQPMMETGRGDGYTPNADFDTPEKQRAYYAENPAMGRFTRTLQDYNPFASLQERLDPGSTVRQAEIALSGVKDAGIIDGGLGLDPQQRAEMARQAAESVSETGGGGNDGNVGDGGSTEGGRGVDGTATGGMGESPARAQGGSLYLASGGLAALARGGMKQGGFVVPADVVSMVGEGNTDAGYRRIMALLPGATPIKGKDGGQSDTVKTNIEGKQPARVAHGEMYIPPEVVKKAGGAKKLYAMMDKVRQQATGSKKQIKPVRLERAMA